MSFQARYRGLCCECGEPFEVDTPINSSRNNPGRYQHEICPEDEPEKPTRFVGTTLEEMGF